jgi:hypothetical protein
VELLVNPGPLTSGEVDERVSKYEDRQSVGTGVGVNDAHTATTAAA